VCVVFVCLLCLALVPLSVVLGALGSLRLLSILAIHFVCYLRPCRLQQHLLVYVDDIQIASKEAVDVEHVKQLAFVYLQRTEPR
jgi:hypothetical protein